MADSRRVQLTTLPPGPVPSEPGPKPRKSPSAGPRAEVGRPDPGTVRLELALFEADERSSPEFSYSRLVDCKINWTKEKVPLSRLEEEEKRATDEVAAISRKLENLYGDKPKKQQQQQQKEDRIQDLIDIGFGYDDEDSFIDNSEAYDEFVPASITTRLGGFYVNSGVLHFRQVSGAEEDEELTTDEETPESPKVNRGHDKPKKKRRTEGAIAREAESSAVSESGPDATATKKRKKKMASAGPLSVTSMLKKFQREKEKERQKLAKAPQKSVAAAVAAAVVPAIVFVPADAGGVPGLTDPLLSLIGSTDDHALIQAANAVDFDIDLDSLLDVTEQTSAAQPGAAAEAPLFRSKADEPMEAAAAAAAAPPLVRPPDPEPDVRPPPRSAPIPPPPLMMPQCVVPLPEGLSPRLEVSIRKLLAVIKTSEGEKLKFFTPEINSALLDIELQCREQGVQLRSKVYTHLSAFLPCSRDTLLKRVKKLFLAHTEEPPDADDPLQKLKEAIGRAMPEQSASFRESCRLHELGRTARATEEEKVEDNLEEKGGRRGGAAGGGGGGGGGPKKSFRWNEEIRRGLCEVLRVRMESYSTRGSQEMELQLRSLLDNEVQPLWPKGWMQCRVLLRESRKMLSLFTPPPVKPARLEKRSALAPPPSLKGLPREADDVIIVSSSFCAEKKETASAAAAAVVVKRLEAAAAAADAVSRTPAEAERPPVKAAPAPAQHSLLDLLADQALARVQPHMASQELLAAAVAKYKRSVRHWSFDAKSPPLPPPPPQSSPVDFPLTHAPPPLLPVGDFARHMDAGHVLIISDDDDDDAAA